MKLAPTAGAILIVPTMLGISTEEAETAANRSRMKPVCFDRRGGSRRLRQARGARIVLDDNPWRVVADLQGGRAGRAGADLDVGGFDRIGRESCRAGWLAPKTVRLAIFSLTGGCAADSVAKSATPTVRLQRSNDTFRGSPCRQRRESARTPHRSRWRSGVACRIGSRRNRCRDDHHSEQANQDLYHLLGSGC